MTTTADARLPSGGRRRHTHLATVLGELLAIVEDGPGGDALVGLYFPGHTYPPAPDALGDPAVDDDPFMASLAAQLRDYLAGRRRDFTVPVRTHGDAFAESVWALLRAIPYGTTTTYGELAASLGDRRMAQAVGQAAGHNPVSIVIPCHRVLGSDGSLRGFAGGLDRKRVLLELEEPVSVRAARLF